MALEPQWLDAQPFLRRVCGGMGVGELLHGESFSLFESTTAIEIGDPKMDIGLHRSEEMGSAEELIAGGAAPVHLPPRLLLSVLDRLLCLEAAWHTGSVLPQTVFTSLYMLHPDRLAANLPLHAFCLSVRSVCSVFIDYAHAGSVTEDEDFSVHTFGMRMLDLPGTRPVKAALQALATAEEQLEQRVAGGGSGSASGGSSKAGGKASSKAGRAAQQQQPQQQSEGKSAGGAEATGAAGAAAAAGGEGGGEESSPEEAAALLARIRFRRLLLDALLSLQQYSQAGVEQAVRQLQLADAQLALVLSSASLAAPLEQAPGFVPEVNRRHMGHPHVPPRPAQPVGFPQAVEHWRGLLRALASGLRSLLNVKGSWPALKAVLVEFASKGHHAIVRSAIHLQLIKPLPLPPAVGGAGGAPAAALPQNGGKAGGGKKAAVEVPAWCPGQQMVCREFGVSLASVPCPEASLFLEQAAIALQGQAYALCLNRCRQRRRLRRQLEDWRNIFDHGYNADVVPAVQEWLAKAGWRWNSQREGLLQGQGPAATWAEKEGAACALLHLQLGFPLDLYAPAEYLQLYWYCDYLLGCQQRLGSYLHAAAPQPAKHTPQARGGKPRGGRGGAQQQQQQQQLSAGEQQAAVRERELLLLDVERMVSQGMFRTAIALQQLGCLVPTQTPFNSEEQQYQQRFGCMETLCRPDPLPYEHYVSSTDASGLPPVRVLGVAVANFQRGLECAAALLRPPLCKLLREEQVRHLEGVQRVATQNVVACRLLAATSVKAAAASKAAAEAAAKEGQGNAGQASQPPPFKAHFDLRTALDHSTAYLYPAVVLKH